MRGTSNRDAVEAAMEHEEKKIDESVLALLYLTTYKDGSCMRAWKEHDWAALERLFKAGYISNPKNKAKSVRLRNKDWRNRRWPQKAPRARHGGRG
jgi:hypothetical protein